MAGREGSTSLSISYTLEPKVLLRSVISGDRSRPLSRADMLSLEVGGLVAAQVKDSESVFISLSGELWQAARW